MRCNAASAPRGSSWTAYAFLKETPDPSEEQIESAISGNICRCTGYIPIVKAIRAAAGKETAH